VSFATGVPGLVEIETYSSVDRLIRSGTLTISPSTSLGLEKSQAE
jgi:hypothetical protein